MCRNTFIIFTCTLFIILFGSSLKAYCDADYLEYKCILKHGCQDIYQKLENFDIFSTIVSKGSQDNYVKETKKGALELLNESNKILQERPNDSCIMLINSFSRAYLGEKKAIYEMSDYFEYINDCSKIPDGPMEFIENYTKALKEHYDLE